MKKTVCVYRYGKRLIGTVVEQEFNNVNVIFLSGNIQRCKSILQIQSHRNE